MVRDFILQSPLPEFPTYKEFGYHRYQRSDLLNIEEIVDQLKGILLSKLGISDYIDLKKKDFEHSLSNIKNINTLRKAIKRRYKKSLAHMSDSIKLSLGVAITELKIIKNLSLISDKSCEIILDQNYLSDFLKSTTGNTAIEHIHNYIIERAKIDLISSNKSISEIAFELGFEYPHYFSRLFKRKTGMTPSKYQKTNN